MTPAPLQRTAVCGPVRCFAVLDKTNLRYYELNFSDPKYTVHYNEVLQHSGLYMFKANIPNKILRVDKK